MRHKLAFKIILFLTIYNATAQAAGLVARVASVSESFLGKPYQLNPLGDGKNDLFDQLPFYRLDKVDCETFVTTVLAQATSSHNYKSRMLQLRYQHPPYTFITRNHFMEINWNINNQKIGIIRDITQQFKDAKGRDIAKVATAWIEPSSWYSKLPLSTIRLRQENRQLAKLRWQMLKILGKKMAPVLAHVAYLPLDAVLSKDKFVLRQIPQSAVIEIVRPNWQTKATLGTQLLISHLGFAIWKSGILYFRQASSILGKVVDVPLVEYLKESVVRSPSIGGINVQMVEDNFH